MFLAWGLMSVFIWICKIFCINCDLDFLNILLRNLIRKYQNTFCISINTNFNDLICFIPVGNILSEYRKPPT